MDKLEVERVGGLAGFGGPHLRSRGVLDLESLSPADQAAVERLFAAGGAPPPPGAADMVTYRISRETAAGRRTIEVAEDAAPAAVAACVQDTLD